MTKTGTALQAPMRIAVSGASGRLGQVLLGLIADDVQWQLTDAWVGTDDPMAGQPTGHGAVRYETLEATDISGRMESRRPQVVIDFSAPSAMRPLLELVKTQGIPLVSGTTGLGLDEQHQLQQAGQSLPVLWAPNFSLTVLLWQDFLRQLAQVHGDSWQARIEETHRLGKKDAPSGTALALAQSLLQPGRGSRPAIPKPVPNGSGNEQEFSLGPISLKSHRRGQVPGIHRVVFESPGETLEMRHEAHSPELFARGALQAARWLAQQPPGNYTLQQMLKTTVAG